MQKERFSTLYRKTKTRIITLTNHKTRKAAFTRQIFVGQHVLVNSKKLANSCVHTSNTRQIANMASNIGAMAHTESCRFRLAFILCFSSKKQQNAMEKQKGLGKIIHKIIHFNATSSIFFYLFAASLYPLDEISHKSGHD